VKVVRRRLLETFQHVLHVTKDLDSIKPGGDGFAASIRVRLLHAAVRRRIMQLSKDKPGYYDVEENGIPVNDLDSIGTVSTFSALMIYVGLPRQGIYLRQQEAEDYVALWRWIAYVLGTPDEWFSTPHRARVIMESLVLSEIDPTETSKKLANNILTGLANQPPTNMSREFLAAQTYWVNGPTLSAALAIERPPIFYSALVFAQCLFFMSAIYTTRSIGFLDTRNNKVRPCLSYTLSP
jgi:hypothetical protein